MNRILFLLLLMAALTATAQVTNEKEPPSWALINTKSNLNKIVLPAIDNAALLEKVEQPQGGMFNKPYKFGEKIDVDLNLFNSGEWTTLKNGDRIWKLHLQSVGAKTINFLFDSYYMPEGGEMYIYNDEHSDRIGPYTKNENQETGVLGSWIVEGDNVWIEYFEPAAVRNQGRISIDKVIHGFRGFKNAARTKVLNESGGCNVDVQCNPNLGNANGKDWTTIRDNFRQSVGLIIFNGEGVCTGTMINNTLNNGTPYFYSANHCLGIDDGQGSNFDFSALSFGFEWFSNTPQCANGLNSVAPISPTQVISGAVNLMNHGNSDTTLFLLNQTPPTIWNLYYAGWDRSSNISTAQLGVHHPSGDIMKIARNDQPVFAANRTLSGVTAQTWVVSDWDYGVTERGSSGSPLINQDGRIIGELYGGAAACFGNTDNNQEDFYGRFNVAWQGGGTNSTRLRNWLDPNNSSGLTLDGIFPATLSSTDEVLEKFDVLIFPNPSQGIFTIDSVMPVIYKVFNLNGQIIQESQSALSNSQLDLTGAARGLYFVRITSGDQTITKKLIKQ